MTKNQLELKIQKLIDIMDDIKNAKVSTLIDEISLLDDALADLAYEISDDNEGIFASGASDESI